MENIIIQRLSDKGLLVRATRFRWAFVAGLVACGFAAGAAVMYFTRHIPVQPVADQGQQYLLVLHANEPAADAGDNVAEYFAWYQQMSAERSISGEELARNGWTLIPGATAPTISTDLPTSPFGIADGFFLFTAASAEEALRVAASCPHLKHDGTLELRPIQQH